MPAPKLAEHHAQAMLQGRNWQGRERQPMALCLVWIQCVTELYRLRLTGSSMWPMLAFPEFLAYMGSYNCRR